MARDKLVSISMLLDLCASHDKHLLWLLNPVDHDLLVKWKIVIIKLDASPSSYSSSRPIQSEVKDIPASVIPVSHWHPA